ncbi:MAG: DUF1963 domain-containing protein [Phenylobacterium sp.]
MSEGFRAALSWFASDNAIRYGLPLVVVFLLLGGPRQLLLSLRSWFRSSQGLAQHSPSSTGGVLAGVLEATIGQLIRPSLLLIAATEPRFSKLGGDPELPADMGWPAGLERPRTFLAQIDLGELPRDKIDWLPREGRIYAFHDPDGSDAPDAVSVIFGTAPPRPPLSPPVGAKRLAERRVTFWPCTCAPSLDWLGLDASELALSDEEFRRLSAMDDAPPPDEIQHRIGGYPNEIQPERMWLSCEHAARGLPDPAWGSEIPPAIARAAKTWRLLLQIDSDPGLKMNFGDGGRFYVFIRERHARAADFSKTVSLWQTY